MKNTKALGIVAVIIIVIFGVGLYFDSICSLCDGTGKMECYACPDGNGNCVYCEIDGLSEYCTNCHGTGKCSECHGTGEVDCVC